MLICKLNTKRVINDYRIRMMCYRYILWHLASRDPVFFLHVIQSANIRHIAKYHLITLASAQILRIDKDYTLDADN